MLTIETITKTKPWINILGLSYQLTDDQKTEILTVIDLLDNGDHRNRIKIIANFVKYNLDNYKYRLTSVLNNFRKNTIEIYSLQYGETEGKKRYDQYCFTLSTVRSKEYFLNKYGEITGIQKFDDIQKKKLMSLDGFIKRNGLKLGTKKYEDFCKKNQGNWSLERQIELYGDSGSESFKSIKDNVKHTSSLTGYIEKHGPVEGKLLWLRRMDKMHFNSSKQGYIEKYGLEDGLKIMRDRKNTNSENSYIRRYGEIIGKQKFIDWLRKSAKFPGFSKISQDLFNSLINNIPIISKNDIFFATNNYEIRLYNKETKNQYLLDFTIPSLKYCIEFNGDLWHANPLLKYKATDTPIPFYPLLTAHEIWKKDEIKQTFIKNSGYTLKIIWESDYLKNKETIINECISEINTLIKGRLNERIN